MRSCQHSRRGGSRDPVDIGHQMFCAVTVMRKSLDFPSPPVKLTLHDPERVDHHSSRLNVCTATQVECQQPKVFVPDFRSKDCPKASAEERAR